jgi:hypothetical protein
MIEITIAGATAFVLGGMLGFIFGLLRAANTVLGIGDGQRDTFEWLVQHAPPEVLAAMRMRITREEIRRSNGETQRSWSP